jgi:hypothetical protein
MFQLFPLVGDVIVAGIEYEGENWQLSKHQTRRIGRMEVNIDYQVLLNDQFYSPTDLAFGKRTLFPQKIGGIGL